MCHDSKLQNQSFACYLLIISFGFLLQNLRPHDRNFLACINNENFFKSRYRTKYSLRVRGYFCSCICSSESWITPFSLAKFLGSIARYNWSEKTSHFSRQLNEAFEALFKRTRNLFVQKFNGKMLKTPTKANFCCSTS